MIELGRAIKTIESITENNSEDKSLKLIIEMISCYIDDYKVSANTRNCGQIVDILLAYLYPDAPLSSITQNCVEQGSMPSFNEDVPHKYSLHRSAACFVEGVQNGSKVEIQKLAAEKILYHIEELGYLPQDFIDN